MKKVLSIITVFTVFSIFAQAPQKMSYQAILRNTSDGLIINTAVGMKVSILKGSVTGTVVYEETHSPTTNINGLVSIEIGSGNVTSGIFSSINWGNDSYFIKTETDPTGGSNYTITGTSQLLSVPYALYAENTKSTGKSTIYLKGGITNAEAADRLSRELGPSTEYIYIINTTVLTTVNLNTATSLIKLTVTDNSALVNLTGNAIETIYDKADIENNPSLATLSFNGLKNADEIFMSHNEALQIVNFPVLEKMTTGITINFMNSTAINIPMLLNGNVNIGLCHNFTTLSLPSRILGDTTISDCQNVVTINLPNYVSGQFSMYTCPALTSFSLPNYTDGTLNLSNNLNLASVSLPNYTTGSFNMNSSLLTTITFPNFTTGSININYNSVLTSITLPSMNITNAGTNGGIAIGNNPALVTVSIPNLQYTPGGSSINITNNPALTTISAPNLLIGNLLFSGASLSTVDLHNMQTAGIININNSNIQTINLPALTSGAFDFRNNPQLASITMPNLTTVYGLVQQFSNNHLSSASVNSILHQFTLVPGLSGMSIYLNQQNPLAPPTGQGITDKATLIASGNLVRTD